MIQFDNGGQLCEDLDDLPCLDHQDTVFVDFETTSGDPKLDSLNPWHHCYIAGIAVKVPNYGKSWYVPIGHNRGGNLPYEPIYQWLTGIIQTCSRWVNHNVKYDAHVYSNNTGERLNCKLFDTLSMAKLVDSDRMRYSLDMLAGDWLKENIHPYEEALKPYVHKNKDYGWIPSDVMAPYACQDVMTNERLYEYILKNVPADSLDLMDTEEGVTSVLYDIERNGMHIDLTRTRMTQLKTMQAICNLDEEIEKLIGWSINPGSNNDCYDILVNKHGLPVLAFNESGNPSFDKHALAQYLAHPRAPKKLVELMLQYRKHSIFLNTFLTPYLEQNIDGVLHPSYNQTVRTGRMSCREPNMQQLMKPAKELIEPHEGNLIVSADYSQIEFRLIAHYIKDPDCIAAYNENPDTDYHQWVADLCGIKRKPAKTVNFMMGYGGGKKKLVTNLSHDPDVISDIDTSDPIEFSRLAEVRGVAIYDTYHSRLPSLRHTSKVAENLCRSRGYVKNLYGRHRRLPAEHSRKAFNSVCQSSAADLMKERLVALHRAGIATHIGVVHDDIVMEVRKEDYTHKWRCMVAEIMESPTASVRVPIRVGIGASDKNWLEASDNSQPVHWKQ